MTSLTTISLEKRLVNNLLKWTIILIGMTFSYFVKGQQFEAQTYLNQTVMGLQKGYGARILSNRGFGLGFITQSNLTVSEYTGSNYSFSGSELILPITKCGKLQVLLTPKVGLVDKKFFVFIPELETRIAISGWMSLGINTGIRAKQASSGIKLMIHPKFR